MQLKTATRKNVKLRLNIASPSGFGKTYSALLIAFGITQNWSKVAVIDTENDSSSLYAHLGSFKTLNLLPPFTPDRYIEAITVCEAASMEVIIMIALPMYGKVKVAYWNIRMHLVAGIRIGLKLLHCTRNGYMQYYTANVMSSPLTGRNRAIIWSLMEVRQK